MESEIQSENHIVVFNDKNIRRTFHNNEWWFVITDVIAALTDSVNSSLYLKAMKRRDPELNKGWVQIVSPLSVETCGGKQKLNCSNTEGYFVSSNRSPHLKQSPLNVG